MWTTYPKIILRKIVANRIDWMRISYIEKSTDDETSPKRSIRDADPLKEISKRFNELLNI